MRGLNTKTETFYLSTIEREDIDVFVITESWLQSNISSSEIFVLDKYVIFVDLLLAGKKREGGVILATKSKLNVVEINLEHQIVGVELICVKLKLETKSFYILGFYLATNNNAETYTNFFSLIESLQFTLNSDIFIVGDLNIIDLNNYYLDGRCNAVIRSFLNFQALINLNQHNRIVNANNRILDVVLATKNLEVQITKADEPQVAVDLHHPPLEIQVKTIKGKVSFLKPNKTESFDFSKADFLSLYNDLK